MKRLKAWLVLVLALGASACKQSLPEPAPWNAQKRYRLYTRAINYLRSELYIGRPMAFTKFQEAEVTHSTDGHAFVMGIVEGVSHADPNEYFEFRVAMKEDSPSSPPQLVHLLPIKIEKSYQSDLRDLRYRTLQGLGNTARNP